MFSTKFTIDSKLGLKGKRTGSILQEAILIQADNSPEELERIKLAEDVAYLSGAQKFRYLLRNNLYENPDKQDSFIKSIVKEQDLEYDPITNELYAFLW